MFVTIINLEDYNPELVPLLALLMLRIKELLKKKKQRCWSMCSILSVMGIYSTNVRMSVRDIHEIIISFIKL